MVTGESLVTVRMGHSPLEITSGHRSTAWSQGLPCLCQETARSKYTPEIPAHGRQRQKDPDYPRLHENFSRTQRRNVKIIHLSSVSHAACCVFLHTRLYLSSLQELTHPDPWWAGSSTSFSQILVGTTHRYMRTLNVFSGNH